MQITSQSGSMVLDYYPIRCPITNNISTDYMFKVLSFMGNTVKKSVINFDEFAEDIDTRIVNHNYIVTDNKKGLPQLVNINHPQYRRTKWN